MGSWDREFGEESSYNRTSLYDEKEAKYTKDYTNLMISFLGDEYTEFDSLWSIYTTCIDPDYLQYSTYLTTTVDYAKDDVKYYEFFKTVLEKLEADNNKPSYERKSLSHLCTGEFEKIASDYVLKCEDVLMNRIKETSNENISTLVKAIIGQEEIVKHFTYPENSTSPYKNFQYILTTHRVLICNDSTVKSVALDKFTNLSIYDASEYEKQLVLLDVKERDDAGYVENITLNFSNMDSLEILLSAISGINQ